MLTVGVVLHDWRLTIIAVALYTIHHIGGIGCRNMTRNVLISFLVRLVTCHCCCWCYSMRNI